VKCLRCGYCCQRLLVVVVDDPDGPLAEPNLMTFGLSGDGSDPCKHLRGAEPGSYSCAVHDRPWYPRTPCAAYQSHWPERKCPMGVFIVEEGHRLC